MNACASLFVQVVTELICNTLMIEGRRRVEQVHHAQLQDIAAGFGTVWEAFIDKVRCILPVQCAQTTGLRCEVYRNSECYFQPRIVSERIHVAQTLDITFYISHKPSSTPSLCVDAFSSCEPYRRPLLCQEKHQSSNSCARAYVTVQPCCKKNGSEIYGCVGAWQSEKRKNRQRYHATLGLREGNE